MDQQEIQKRVRAAQARQSEIRENLLAVKGQIYLSQVQTLSGILMLARSLTRAGYPDAAQALADSATVCALIGFGIAEDSERLATIGRDAIALTDVSYVSFA